MHRKEQSVEQALKRGRRMLSYPSSIIPKIIIGILVGLSLLKIVDWRITLISIPLSLFLFPVIYRSFMNTKWKLQSLESVRNVNELWAKAIMEGIISKETGILEKYFRTSAEKHKMEELEKKFKTPDIFDNHPEIPFETLIYYPRRLYLTGAVFFLLGMIISPYFYWTTKKVIFLFVIPGAAYFCWQNLRKLRRNKPCITLNEKGIATTGFDLVGWEFITEEKVLKGGGDDDGFYLVFNHPGGEERVAIDQLPIKPVKLYELLAVYRGRFNESNKDLNK